MNTPSTTLSLTPTASTTNLVRPQKDYALALANLQDSYGLNGSYAPTFNLPSGKPNSENTLPSTVERDLKPKHAISGLDNSKSKYQIANRISSSKVNKPKDYEAAFAALASSYGVGGHAPSRPPRQETIKKSQSQSKSGKRSIISWFSGFRSK
jgi:hypothetical protein